MRICEYCGKKTKNKRFCSLNCSGHIIGKIGGKAVSFVTHSKAGKLGGKRCHQLYPKEMKEWTRKGGKKGGVAVQHTLRVNIRNLKYEGQYYDSNPEREISICLMHQFDYKPKENKNLHIRMKGGEVDYLLESLKLFIEYHQYFRDETYEEYCDRRRKLLDNNGYKDYKLVVIK